MKQISCDNSKNTLFSNYGQEQNVGNLTRMKTELHKLRLIQAHSLTIDHYQRLAKRLT